jgi:phage terminase large subunit
MRKKWQAVKNSSWSERHAIEFGDKSGYVICNKNTNGELVGVATVIGMPFVEQKEIDANARLIESAPELYSIVKEFYSVTKGAFNDPVIQEDLFNKIENLIQRINQ